MVWSILWLRLEGGGVTSRAMTDGLEEGCLVEDFLSGVVRGDSDAL